MRYTCAHASSPSLFNSRSLRVLRTAPHRTARQESSQRQARKKNGTNTPNACALSEREVRCLTVVFCALAEHYFFLSIAISTGREYYLLKIKTTNVAERPAVLSIWSNAANGNVTEVLRSPPSVDLCPKHFAFYTPWKRGRFSVFDFIVRLSIFWT